MEGEVPAAENAADNITILEQIAELNRIQQQAAASIAALSQDTPRSYVYVPRERHTVLHLLVGNMTKMAVQLMISLKRLSVYCVLEISQRMINMTLSCHF